MKILRVLIAVILTVFMAAYMMLGSVLFAVDLSFDEKNVQKALGSSDALYTLVQSAEISINAVELKDSDIDRTELYRHPASAALFADIFTGTARYVLYDEEYNCVNEELVRNYLRAVAEFENSRNLSESELEDYVSVKLQNCLAQFNGYISGMEEEFLEEEEITGTIRFLFNDLKFICILGAALHLLILILLIKGRLGYFCVAAAFGVSGIFMLVFSGGIGRIVELSLPRSYAEIVSLIFRERFALVGALLFAAFSVLVALALILHIFRKPSKD